MKIIYNIFSAPLTSQILSTLNSMIVGLIEDFECQVFKIIISFTTKAAHPGGKSPLESLFLNSKFAE